MCAITWGADVGVFDGRRWEVGGRLVLVGVRLLFVVVVGTVVVVVLVAVAMTVAWGG